jgi:hypothetical protein
LEFSVEPKHVRRADTLLQLEVWETHLYATRVAYCQIELKEVLKKRRIHKAFPLNPTAGGRAGSPSLEVEIEWVALLET